MKITLSALDWFIVLLYCLAVVLIGVFAGRKEKDAEDYFLGGRRMPWWAVMVSIYATALSALTYIGVPGVAFSGDFHYLQLGLGDFFGRILIASLLLTAYYRAKVMSVYELLGQRFGPWSHGTGTAFFIVTRLLASGVRLAGCAIALSVIFSMPLSVAILLIAGYALTYTLIGGIKAVIWTDMVQLMLLLLAAFVVIGVVLASLPRGWSDFIAIGNAHEKFKILHISFTAGTRDYWLNFGNPDSLVAGFLLGCFTTLAVLGTDQDLVQRMLTCKKVGESQRAIFLTGIMNFPITLLFLGIGAALFAYYQVHPDPQVTQLVTARKTDYIFPHFIKTVLGPGLRGLLIAGLLAASSSAIDSALSALASSAYADVYKKHVRPHGGDEHAVAISRWLVVLFAAILVIIGLSFCKAESILWLGFRIFGYTYGALLGIFLLAVLTKSRGNDRVNAIAMATSILVVLFLTAPFVGALESVRAWLLHPLGIRAFAWPWAIMIGMIWTFGVGMAFASKPRKA